MLTEALVVSAVLFVIGTFGVLIRRNAIIMRIKIGLIARDPDSEDHCGDCNS